MMINRLPSVRRRGVGRAKLALLLLLLTLVVSGCGGQHTFNGTKYDPPLAAPPLVGTNWDGTPFDLSALKGKVALIFFGYTFCPDICPVTLAEMKQVYNALGDAQDDVAVVFVTVDPERDTVERLAQYIPAFDPSFYGVYVSPDELDAVKKDFGVFAEKRDPGDASSVDYLVDHSGWIYVVDPKGDFRVAFGHDAASEDIVPDVQYLLR
jgi:protein SCO1/2